MFPDVLSLIRRLRFAFGCYLVTAIMVLASAIYGIFNLSEDSPNDFASALQEIAHRWDSEWYLDIASVGYQYERAERGQSVAFFPLFPVLVSTVAVITGLSIEWSGLIASQACLLSAFLLLALYLQNRFAESPNIQKWTLLAFTVFPAGFYWRFLYSESVFLLLAIAVLYSIQRRWSLLLCAFLVGLTTAARPVGVALIPAFIHYAFAKNSHLTRREAIRLVIPYLPISCFGLIAYMAFLYMQFGEPLAFATTQHYWRVRPVDSVFEMLASFAAWEPIWSVYVPNTYWYWGRVEEQANPLLSLAFWNPIVFVSFVFLVIAGWRKSWLRTEEVLVCAGLLLIPYFLRGFHFCLLSQARFAAVVFPAYIVMAHLLVSSPRVVRWVSMAVALGFLTYFAARFSAGFKLI